MSEDGDNNSNHSWRTCNSSNASGGLPSMSSVSDVDYNMFNNEAYGLSSLSPIRSDSMLSMTYGSDAASTLSRAVADDSDREMYDSVCSISENSMDEFIRWKMLDRPPCYDDIIYDRVASPIADSYDEAHDIADLYDEPHPLNGPSHYARPGPLLQQRTPNPSSSSSDEVVRPNYSTVTEVTTMTTSEVVIRRANQENMIRYIVSILYSNCKFPKRNYSTRCMTVYEHPVMTTAIAQTPVREIGWRSEYTSTRCAFSNTVNAVDNHFL